MELLIHRISQARTSAQGMVSDQIRMYKAIAPDVVDLHSTLSRLVDEFKKYDARHYGEHEDTQKALTSMERLIRKTTLLEAQVAVAKRIEKSRPDAQGQLWITEMDPLILQENGVK